jgi:hypothetical protein
MCAEKITISQLTMGFILSIKHSKDNHENCKETQKRNGHEQSKFGRPKWLGDLQRTVLYRHGGCVRLLQQRRLRCRGRTHFGNTS